MLGHDIDSIVWRYLFDDVLVELREVTGNLIRYYDYYDYMKVLKCCIGRCLKCKHYWSYIIGCQDLTYLRSDCVGCGMQFFIFNQSHEPVKYVFSNT